MPTHRLNLLRAVLTFLLLLSVDHDSIVFDCFVVIVIGIWHSFCYCCCCGKAWWLFLLCWQHRSFIAVHSLLLLLASLSLSLMPLLLVFVDSIVIPLLTSYSWLLLSMLTLLVLLYLMVMVLGVLLLYLLERSLSGSLIADFMCTSRESILVGVVLYCIFGMKCV